MGHSEGVDRESLWREVTAGAHAWQIGDCQAAANRLRAGVRGAHPGPRAVLPRRRLPARPLPARPVDARRACSPIRWPRPVPVTFLAPARAIEDQAAADPEARRAAAGDRRRLGRRRRRYLFRGRGCPAAAGVDPLAIRSGRRRLPRPPRRAERRDLRPPTVRPVRATPADRQAVRHPLRAAHVLRRRAVPAASRDQAALGRPRWEQSREPAAAPDGRRPAVAGLAAGLAAGGHDARRPRRRGPDGPLAQPRRAAGSPISAGWPPTRRSWADGPRSTTSST